MKKDVRPQLFLNFELSSLMKNPNVMFAGVMFCLMVGIGILTKITPPRQPKIIIWTLPESKGCHYPTKQIRYIRTEVQHIVPTAQVHKCFYDSSKRLTKVSTYNFERGYQLVKPTKEVRYKWSNYRLLEYSIRRATHGSGEVDAEVYRLGR